MDVTLGRFGPYELLERLSTGGMAEVLRAKDTRTGGIVALKRLLPKSAEHEDLAQMFLEEARIAAPLDHPNVVRLVAHGAVEGVPFIAYELVDGVDLGRLFEHANAQGTRLPIPFLCAVFVGIAGALEYAHERRPGLVHRDISLRNIMLSFAGDVKLIDFGIAKADDSETRTATGIIKGKFGYLSPEQVRGAPVNPRSDLFSLGTCLWEMLTLRRLFAAANEIVVLDMIKRHVPSPPSTHRPDVPPELDRIVIKILANDPDERYGSARQLARDLSVFVDESGSTDAIAQTLRASFRDERLPMGSARAGRAGSTPALASLGSNMELQETRMSDDNKGGSDLDIFEGLGKKSSGRISAVPPPPPGSSSHLTAAKPMPAEMKRTLLGIPGPALGPGPSSSSIPSAPPTSPASRPPTGSAPPPMPPSGSMRAAQPASKPPMPGSKPPPPPGRGALPNMSGGASGSQPPQQAAPPSTSAPRSTPPPLPAPAPPAPSTRPTPVAAASQPNGRKLDMDWDDDNEATHVFDKESKDSEKSLETPGQGTPDRADMDAILSSPPRASAPPAMPVPAPAAGTPPPPAQATLSGAFANLGNAPTNGSGSAPPPSLRSGPPSHQMRSAPPPPPGSLRSPSGAPTAALPPPPPPGQATTAPMHMPPRPPSSIPPAHAQMPSHPPNPQYSSAPPQMHSQQPMPHMPPVSRAMEATAMVPRPQPSRTGLWIAVLLGVCAVAGFIAFYMMSRPGTILVNVADAKGSEVPNLEIYIDDAKKCDKAPCVVHDVPSGAHIVKVVAQGYDQTVPRAINVEARGQATVDVSLAPTKSAGGTGFKVTSTQTGVKIAVDGKDAGTLPADIHDLEAGDHTLKLSAGDRYAPLEKTIHVGKDEIVDMGNVMLKVLKGKATIQLGTPGAKVYLVSGTNRKEVPQFPIAIDFDPNEHWQLEAKKDGFDDLVQPISFDDGQAEKTITVTLSPKGAPTPAFVAPAPVPQPHAAAPAPRPQPAADNSDDAKPAKSDSGKSAPAAAAGGEAFLNINSLPSSTVLLDGKPLGPTPRVHVSVTPGQHTILFVNAEQSLKKSITVTVGSGETKAAFAKLRE